MTCRHEYEYGCFLDSLRGKKPSKQIDIVNKSKKYQTISAADIDGLIREHNVRIISGNHKRVNEFNQIAKNLKQQLPFRIVKKCQDKGQIRILPTDTPNVYWDRKEVIDENVPQGTQYEPALASTCDAFQGQTIKKDSDIILIIDVRSMDSRHGVFYTAITRTQEASQIRLLL